MENIFKLLNEINYFETKIFKGLHKPEAIFFDWENTIVRKKKIDDYDSEKYDLSFIYNNQDSKTINHNNSENIYEYELIEKQKIIELLNFINRQKIFCGIISNKNNKRLNFEIENFRLKNYFQKIIGEGDCPSKKPMIDPLIYALEKTEIEFGKTIWFIGDSASDMEFASLTLCTGILYNPNKKNDDFNYFTHGLKKQNKNINDLSEDLEIKTMDEILNILKTIFSE
jgi:phosphoglycolate phosphatase